MTLPASGRRVLSKLRNPVAAVTELSGEQGFLLTVAGEAHQLSVEVAPGGTPSTQEVCLKRVAGAIGGADARIKAEVVYEFVDARDPAARSRPMNRVVRLQIASASGGEGVDFSLEDAAGSRLVAAYGLDKGSPRHGALLEVGGNELRQAEDQVSLDQGRVTATALAATHGEARVAVEEGLAEEPAARAEVGGQLAAGGSGEIQQVAGQAVRKEAGPQVVPSPRHPGEAWPTTDRYGLWHRAV